MGRGNQTGARQITMERTRSLPIIRIQCILRSFIQNMLQSTLLHGNKTTKKFIQFLNEIKEKQIQHTHTFCA